MQPLIIESLDQDGRGVAHRDGKVIFIEGALAGETVLASVYRKKPSYEQALVERVLHESASRVEPRCRYFGLCGGCSLQHLEPRAQVAAKQRVLEDSLWHIGKVRPDEMLSAVHGPGWGYRHRARLTARYVRKKDRALIGFHEKRSTYVADMASCEVLPPRISALIAPLQALFQRLSIRERLPQVEIAAGDEADVLVLRVLEPPSADDEALLRAFAIAHGVAMYLQPRGPDSIVPFHPPEGVALYYSLPEFQLRIGFRATDFTQINHATNRVLVRKAMALLAPNPGERIADFFCGIGNFSLPIARRGATVMGVEGSRDLVERATRNAADNGLSDLASFSAADLFKVDTAWIGALGHLDGMLIDPPRDGAAELVKSLPDSGPMRIVYVSCNAATLARDAGMLVHTKGYILRAAGIVNMFPHTAHVESIALFIRA